MEGETTTVVVVEPTPAPVVEESEWTKLLNQIKELLRASKEEQIQLITQAFQAGAQAQQQAMETSLLEVRNSLNPLSTSVQELRTKLEQLIQNQPQPIPVPVEEPIPVVVENPESAIPAEPPPPPEKKKKGVQKI